ncbi:MAG: leucine-rich repeat domain-containing protein [bacterium]
MEKKILFIGYSYSKVCLLTILILTGILGHCYKKSYAQTTLFSSLGSSSTIPGSTVNPFGQYTTLASSFQYPWDYTGSFFSNQNSLFPSNLFTTNFTNPTLTFPSSLYSSSNYLLNPGYLTGASNYSGYIDTQGLYSNVYTTTPINLTSFPNQSISFQDPSQWYSAGFGTSSYPYTSSFPGQSSSLASIFQQNQDPSACYSTGLGTSSYPYTSSVNLFSPDIITSLTNLTSSSISSFTNPATNYQNSSPGYLTGLGVSNYFSYPYTQTETPSSSSPQEDLTAEDYYCQAMDYYYNNNPSYELAFDAFDKAIEKKQDYIDAYFYRGCAHYEYGDYNKALADYQKVIVLGKEQGMGENPFYVYYWLEKAYYKKGDYDRTIEIFEIIKKMLQNRLNLSDGADLSEAIDEKIPGECFELSDVYSFLGKAYLMKQEYALAITAITKALYLFPSSPDYIYRGLVYYAISNGNPEAASLAIEDFTTAIQRGEENGTQYFPKAYLFRAGVYYEQGNYTAANNDYDTFIRLNIGDSDVYSINYINDFMGRNIPEFIKLNSDLAASLAEAYFKQGRGDYFKGDYKNAIKKFEIARTLCSESENRLRGYISNNIQRATYCLNNGPVARIPKLMPIPNERLIVIPDFYLEESIHETLMQKIGKPISYPLTDNDKFALASLTSLTTVSFCISNLSGLEKFPNLEELNLRDNNIKDLSPLKGLANLKRLDLSKNWISDLSLLEGAKWPKLTYLSLAYNQINKLTYLDKITSLKSLLLHHNRLEDKKGDEPVLSPLKLLGDLETLSLFENQISEISPLKGLLRLIRLYAHVNKISDLNAFNDTSELKFLNLKYLYLNNNLIIDPTPLLNLLNITDPYRNPMLSRLALSNNPIAINTLNTLKERFKDRLVYYSSSSSSSNFSNKLRKRTNEVNPDQEDQGIVFYERNLKLIEMADPDGYLAQLEAYLKAYLFEVTGREIEIKRKKLSNYAEPGTSLYRWYNLSFRGDIELELDDELDEKILKKNRGISRGSSWS